MNPGLNQPSLSQPGLSQLRDIHLPAPISWWPPAPGWWILITLIVAILIGLFIWFRRRQRDNWRRAALAELARLRQQCADQPTTVHTIIAELSVLLRRVAISCFPRTEVAMLHGDKWLAFLNRSLDEPLFQSEQSRLLAVAPYAPNTSITPDDLAVLFTLCESWVNKLPAKGNT